MPLLSIVKFGDSVLRKKTEDIPQIDEPLLQTISDMFRTMYAAPGIGLAANQVGLSRNFAVIDIQPGGQKHPFVIINPVIEARSGAIYEEEGCLSVPGFGGKIAVELKSFLEARSPQPEIRDAPAPAPDKAEIP